MATPRVTVYQSESNQQWYWTLKAENGEIIAQGEGYASKANALRGVANVIEDMARAEVVEEGGA